MISAKSLGDNSCSLITQAHCLNHGIDASSEYWGWGCHMIAGTEYKTKSGVAGGTVKTGNKPSAEKKMARMEEMYEVARILFRVEIGVEFAGAD